MSTSVSALKSLWVPVASSVQLASGPFPGAATNSIYHCCVDTGTADSTGPSLTIDHSKVLPPNIFGSYYEPLSGCTVLLADPGAQPALWASYLAGARRVYRLHGVESAIAYASVWDGRSTSLFVVATDQLGHVVGGLRVHGRLSQSIQAHALQEWAGRPGTAEMKAQIAQRLPAGVIEIKAVWVDPDLEDRAALTAALARSFVHALDMLQARYALCTAAEHAVPRWQSSGGVVSTEVPAVAYPDDRYQTSLMWWDRSRVFDLMTEDQYDALSNESAVLFGAGSAAALQSVA